MHGGHYAHYGCGKAHSSNSLIGQRHNGFLGSQTSKIAFLINSLNVALNDAGLVIVAAAGDCHGVFCHLDWHAMIRKSCKTYAGRDPEKGKIMASTEGFLPAVQVPRQTPDHQLTYAGIIQC